jgi:hypothetical protein
VCAEILFTRVLGKALQLHTIALHFRHVNIHCEGITLKTYEMCRWLRVGSGGGKIGEVRQIHSKDTASLNGTRFKPARKENPFVSG